MQRFPQFRIYKRTKNPNSLCFCDWQTFAYTKITRQMNRHYGWISEAMKVHLDFEKPGDEWGRATCGNACSQAHAQPHELITIYNAGFERNEKMRAIAFGREDYVKFSSILLKFGLHRTEPVRYRLFTFFDLIRPGSKYFAGVWFHAWCESGSSTRLARRNFRLKIVYIWCTILHASSFVFRNHAASNRLMILGKKKRTKTCVANTKTTLALRTPKRSDADAWRQFKLTDWMVLVHIA